MKFRLLAALFLSLIAAQPAWAQTDRFDAGDWWWLDTTGRGVEEEAILSNGTGVRTGDRVALDMFIIFREPDDERVIGARLLDVVDCAARTRGSVVRAVIYADGRIVEADNLAGDAERVPLDPETTLYKFACTTERERSTHFGPGSRRGVSDGLFARNPAD